MMSPREAAHGTETNTVVDHHVTDRAGFLKARYLLEQAGRGNLFNRLPGNCTPDMLRGRIMELVPSNPTQEDFNNNIGELCKIPSLNEIARDVLRVFAYNESYPHNELGNL